MARVRVPFRRPFVTGTGRWTQREAWIVRLRGSDATGYGEVTIDPAGDPGAMAKLERGVQDVLATFDPGAVIAQLPEGPSAPIRAALDAALIGCGATTLRRAGMTSIAVNATIDGDAIDDVVARARAAVSAGFETLKLKGGGERSLGLLADRVRAVRDAVGEAVHLRLDVNGSWDLATARVAVAALEPFDLEYVEQPIAAAPDRAELADLAALRQGTIVPIALDESVTDESTALLIMESGAADVLVVKPSRVGGIRAAVRIGDAAIERGLGAVVSNLLETGIGLTAGIAAAGRLGQAGPNVAHGLATADVLVSDLLVEPIRAEAGRVQVRSLTELRVDDDAVRRFAVETHGAPW